MKRLLRLRRASTLVLLFLAFPSIASLSGRAQATVLTEDERNTIEVFQRASRGVVHIAARAVVDSSFEAQDKASKTGTGFVIDREGRILTVFHLIQGMSEIDVVFSGGKRVSARVVGTAPILDIALLQVGAPESELFPLPLGDSRNLQVGQKAVAIGNPIGLHNTLTVGVISALRRSAAEPGTELQDALIQIDAAINPGSSGGPLLNSSGEVIGINSANIPAAQSVGFAIPIHFARRIIPDLIEMGHPYRPQLGFSGSEITPSVAKLFGLPMERGFLVEEVLPGSPAALVGLRAGSRIVILGDKPIVLGGDILTTINGKSISAASDIARTLLDAHPGEIVRLTVYRQGRQLEVPIPLEKMRMQF